MSDGWRESAWLRVEGGISWRKWNQSCQSFAYVRGVKGFVSLGEELRGRFWFNHSGRQSLGPFAIAPQGSIGRRGDLLTTFV